MTKQILVLNLPNNYDLLIDEEVDVVMESLTSEEVPFSLDLAFFKRLREKALVQCVTSCNNELIKNIFCQAVEQNKH